MRKRFLILSRTSQKFSVEMFVLVGRSRAVGLLILLNVMTNWKMKINFKIPSNLQSITFWNYFCIAIKNIFHLSSFDDAN